MELADILIKNVDFLVKNFKAQKISMRKMSMNAGLSARWLNDVVTKLPRYKGGTKIETLEKLAMCLKCRPQDLLTPLNDPVHYGNKKDTENIKY